MRSHTATAGRCRLAVRISRPAAGHLGLGGQAALAALGRRRCTPLSWLLNILDRGAFFALGGGLVRRICFHQERAEAAMTQRP